MFIKLQNKVSFMRKQKQNKMSISYLFLIVHKNTNLTKAGNNKNKGWKTLERFINIAPNRKEKIKLNRKVRVIKF